MSSRGLSEQDLVDIQQLLIGKLRDVTELFDLHKIEYWLDFGSLLGVARDGKIIPWDDDIDLTILRTDLEKAIDALKAISSNNWKTSIQSEGALISSPIKIEFIPWKLYETSRSEKGIHHDYHPSVGIDIYVMDQFKKRPLSKYRKFTSKYFSFLKFAPFYATDLKGVDHLLVIKREIASFSNHKLLDFLLNRSKSNHQAPKYLSHGCETGFGELCFNWETIFPLQFREFEGITVKSPRVIASYLTTIYGPSFLSPPPIKDRKTHGYLLLRDEIK